MRSALVFIALVASAACYNPTFNNCDNIGTKFLTVTKIFMSTATPHRGDHLDISIDAVGQITGKSLTHYSLIFKLGGVTVDTKQGDINIPLNQGKKFHYATTFDVKKIAPKGTYDAYVKIYSGSTEFSCETFKVNLS